MEGLDDLEFLSEYREDNRIEAKRAQGGLPHSLWETYSAFANTLGGVILLGVAEAKDGSLYSVPLLDPEELVEDIIPFIEKKYRVKAGREFRAMAGLSMGSMQTSVTVCSHPELFAWEGLFSGFMHNFMGNNPDNSFLAVMKEERFQKEQRLFFRGMGRQDEFWEQFAEDDVFCEENKIPCVRKEYEGGHDWNVWRQCIRDFLPMLFQEKKPLP